jgi:uncharacterized protein YcbX
MAWLLDFLFARFSKMDIGTAGGLFLYLASFLMFIVPVAILFFELRLESQKTKAKAKAEAESAAKDSKKPPIPPPTVITALQVYPIKSCRGIKLQKAKLLKTGLDLDRKWMFVDKDMKFITIRENSKMTLISTAVTKDDELAVSVKTDSGPVSFHIPAHPTQSWLDKNTELVKTAQIWGTTTDAYMYSKDFTSPLTGFFEQEVRLVMKGPTPRLLGSNGAKEHLGREESTMFPDMMPVLVANEQSLEELNGRLATIGKESITWEHYRPNVVVKGDTPWYEDEWKTLKIHRDEDEDDIVLDVTQRCARCQVSSID